MNDLLSEQSIRQTTTVKNQRRKEKVSLSTINEIQNNTNNSKICQSDLT